MFKDDRRWFKISVKVEELAIDKTRAIQDRIVVVVFKNSSLLRVYKSNICMVVGWQR
jgi:hypothetical protein